MNDRPTAEELLRAVEHFLDSEIVPHAEGVRRFHARVAANVVAMVARELECEDEHLTAEWERLAALLDDAGPLPTARAERREALLARNLALVGRIRAGEADAGAWREQLLVHLGATCAERLEVSRPPRQR